MLKFVDTSQPAVIWLCWPALAEDRLVITGSAGDCPEHETRECIDRYYSSRRLAGMGRLHLLRRRKAWRQDLQES